MNWRLLENATFPKWFVQGSVCLVAFLACEVLQAAVFSLLSLSRPPGFIFMEFVAFAAVAGVLYFQDHAQLLNIRQQSLMRELSTQQKLSRMRPARLNIFENLFRLSEGVAESLSAIMLYARTKMTQSPQPVESRDLKEVMERVDQVQLLVQEMSQLTRENFLESRSQESSSKGSLSLLGDSSVGYAGKNWPKLTQSLRRNSRQVSVLPATIRLKEGEVDLEFQTYTVNISEQGACILFSSESLMEDGTIGIALPADFSSRARIRWIRSPQNNSFRLAGVEFEGVRFSMTEN
jgi:hypothetical protein